MASDGMPDAWIGERVSLRYWRGDGRTTVSGRLDAAGDRGIVMILEVEDGEVSRFYPWSAVLHIQHPASGEEPRREAEVHSF